MCELGDYIESNKIDEKTLDFVYENGVKFVEATRQSNTAIANKVNLLLSYLVIMDSYLFTKFIPYLKHVFLSSHIKAIEIILSCCFGCLTWYYFCIIIFVVYLSKPRELQIGYVMPRELMKKSLYEDNDFPDNEMYSNLKHGVCIGLQNDIDINLDIAATRQKQLETALALTLVFPTVFYFSRYILKFIYRSIKKIIS